jgi:hypothetical protein
LSQYDKDQLKRLSVFNLTAQDQLAYAFERLSELLTEPSAALLASTGEEAAIDVRSSLANFSLKITLLDPSSAASSSSSSQEADCRKKRLLVTLVEAYHAPQATTTSNSFSSPAFPQAALAVSAQESQRHEKQSCLEGSTAFYATG